MGLSCRVRLWVSCSADGHNCPSAACVCVCPAYLTYVMQQSMSRISIFVFCEREARLGARFEPCEVTDVMDCRCTCYIKVWRCSPRVVTEECRPKCDAAGAHVACRREEERTEERRRDYEILVLLPSQ